MRVILVFTTRRSVAVVRAMMTVRPGNGELKLELRLLIAGALFFFTLTNLFDDERREQWDPRKAGRRRVGGRDYLGAAGGGGLAVAAGGGGLAVAASGSGRVARRGIDVELGAHRASPKYGRLSTILHS